MQLGYSPKSAQINNKVLGLLKLVLSRRALVNKIPCRVFFVQLLFQHKKRLSLDRQYAALTALCSCINANHISHGSREVFVKSEQ